MRHRKPRHSCVTGTGFRHATTGNAAGNRTNAESMSRSPKDHEELHCPRCGKQLSRLNRGPFCYACQPEVPDAEARRKSRRRRLPYDEIIHAFRELGDSTKVAERLDLPRSSVWYVVQRAKRDGALPNDG